MDVVKAIRELREELARVSAMIAVLEEKLRKDKSASPAPKRRGRKRMSREERLLVSERMRRYWANRKSAGSFGASAGGSTPPAG
jgi:hypothetical protein